MPLPASAAVAIDAVTIARRHKLVRSLPTPNFFEGMLLGNGDIGVCAVVRPDALGLHIGKLDVWDIRVTEEHVEHLLPFAGVLKLWREAGEKAKQEGRPDQMFLEVNDPGLRAYLQKVRSSYDKIWPRPWPCGTVWIHWDSRQVRVERQELDISTGLYSLELRTDDLKGSQGKAALGCCVNWSTGHLMVEGSAPVTSIAYYPHVDHDAQMPLPELSFEGAGFLCRQRLPATAPTADRPEPGSSEDDRTFALCGRAPEGWYGSLVEGNRPHIFLKPRVSGPLRLDLAIYTSVEDPDPGSRARQALREESARSASANREETRQSWENFWSRSAVEFDDRELEGFWYYNQYLLACCLRPGKVAPGLFGNWSTGNIGTAWHGDYHMNYNTQQVFWGVFSSNHVEQHLPYVDLVEKLLPMAEWNAREQFGLPGAYFPHSAYPVPSNVNPYPAPPWGYEICETPWTVQSLWWHYQHTLDEEYLRRVYPLLRAATVFLAAYARKEADGKYHLNPTVSPENWGLTVDQRLNRDCIIDIALTEFLLDAMIEASKVLQRDEDLRWRWSEIRRNLAPYPRGEGPYGEVWLDIANAPVEHVYNVPVTASPVFPAEQVGLDRSRDLLEIARGTVRTIRLEGGNDLVWQPLARARLGMLDLEWFKREVRYCQLPNGIANDRTRQIGGRYTDLTDNDFMMRMGVWTENLSLPAVLNECLLQSYAGVIRLFPNTGNLGPARFDGLRAAGAFLVSAAWDGRRVTGARIHSERGARLRFATPWKDVVVRSAGKEIPFRRDADILEFDTEAGATYEFVAS